MKKFIYSVFLFGLGAVISAVIGEYTVRTLWSYEKSAISEINRNAGIDEFELVRAPTEQNPLVDEESDFTDLTIFTCSENELPQRTAGLIVDAALKEEFGSVKLGEIRPSTRLTRVLRGYATIVFDNEHPERSEVSRVFDLFHNSRQVVPFQALANTGEVTRWRLTLFLC